MKQYLIYTSSGTNVSGNQMVPRNFKLKASVKAGSPKTALKKAVIGYGLRAGKYLVLAAAGKERGGKLYALNAAEINRMTEAPRGSRSRYYM